jgi:ABC-2 type transport system ATP-binding protein
VWDIVRALVDAGTTVLLTTQYLDEADRLADRIAVIDHGAVIAEGTSSALKASVGAGTLDVRLADGAQRDTARELLASTLAAPVHLDADPASLHASVAEPARVTRALDDLHRAGIATVGFSLGQPSLDEVFLALTGHPADGEPRRDATRGPDATGGPGASRERAGGVDGDREVAA